MTDNPETPAQPEYEYDPETGQVAAQKGVDNPEGPGQPDPNVPPQPPQPAPQPTPQDPTPQPQPQPQQGMEYPPETEDPNVVEPGTPPVSP
jgi:hypothetical protein